MTTCNTTLNKKQYTFISYILLEKVIKDIIILSKFYFQARNYMGPIFTQVKNKYLSILIFKNQEIFFQNWYQ